MTRSGVELFKPVKVEDGKSEIGLIFFFQAEDGIRDDLVTGVQTCALPIFVVLIPCTLRNERPATSIPVLQLQRPFTTERSSTPPAMRRRFKSPSTVPPKNVLLRFQFSFRASK